MNTAKTYRLPQIMEIIGGGTPKTNTARYWNGSIPWITVADMSISKRFIERTEKHISEAGLSESSTKILSEGDLIISARGTVGVVNQIQTPMAFNQTCYGLRPNRDFVDDGFFYYLMLSTSQNLKKIGQGGVFNTITKDLFNSIHVSLPPIQNQRKIASILWAWDRAIDNIDKLISAKQKLKQALMQKLLTGQVRFPGFGESVSHNGDLPKGWKHAALSQIADIIVSNVDKKTDTSESAVHLCNYMDVYKHGYIDNGLELMKASASAEEIRKFKVRKLDILITKDSETPDDIGVPAIITEEIDNVLCGYHLAIIRCKSEKVQPLYLFMAFNGALINEQWKRLANGVTRFGLAVGDIEKITVLMPKIGEQSKISNLLFKLDQEITLLSEAKVKLHKQRDGLMSMLLNPEKHNNGGVYG